MSAETTRTVDGWQARPINGVNRAEVRRLAASIARRGWVGRPLIANDWGNGLVLITGSHRSAALGILDRLARRYYGSALADRVRATLVPVVVTTVDLTDACDDDDRLVMLREAGDTVAAGIMAAEIEANEAWL